MGLAEKAAGLEKQDDRDDRKKDDLGDTAFKKVLAEAEQHPQNQAGNYVPF